MFFSPAIKSIVMYIVSAQGNPLVIQCPSFLIGGYSCKQTLSRVYLNSELLEEISC